MLLKSVCPFLISSNISVSLTNNDSYTYPCARQKQYVHNFACKITKITLKNVKILIKMLF